MTEMIAHWLHYTQTVSRYVKNVYAATIERLFGNENGKECECKKPFPITSNGGLRMSVLYVGLFTTIFIARTVHLTLCCVRIRIINVDYAMDINNDK